MNKMRWFMLLALWPGALFAQVECLDQWGQNKELLGFVECEQWENQEQKPSIFYYFPADGTKNGIAEEYDTQGNIKFAGKYINNKPDGFWKVTLPYDIKTEAHFSNGIKNGKETSFYTDGSIMSCKIYVNGVLHGASYSLFLGDSTHAFYKNGKLDGDKITFRSDGKIEGKKSFIDGIQYGEDVSYNELGQITEIKRYDNGYLIGEHIEYYDNRNLRFKHSYTEKADTGFNHETRTASTIIRGNFDGKPSGEWIEYDEQGNIKSRCQFLNGAPVGKWTEYYDKSLKIEAEEYFENGIPVGKWVRYHPSGNVLSEEVYLEKGESVYLAFTDNGTQFIKGYFSGRDWRGDKIRHGEWIDRTENGDTLLYENFDHGIKHGPYKSFHTYYGEKPGPEETGYYYKGARMGEWRGYYENGNLRYIQYYAPNPMAPSENESYTEDERNRTGEWITYYEDGQLESQGHYNWENKIGLWKEYHPNGTLKSEGSYSDGPIRYETKQGEWKTYHENGQLESIGYFEDGSVISEFKEFFYDGKPYRITTCKKVIYGRYSYSKPYKHGPYKEYYPETGNLKSEGNYEDNSPIGLWREYYENGLPKEICSWVMTDDSMYINDRTYGIYIFSKQDGEIRSFHENGKPYIKGTYQVGKKEGKWVSYFENGNLQSEETYINGKRHGMVIYYYENGKVFSKTKYINGEPVGKTIIYNEN